MSDKQHKDIDEVFRKVLASADNEAGFEVHDWDGLLNMLDDKKKSRKVIFWRTMISSAAALILLALGWWYLATKTEQNPNNVQEVVNKQPKGAETPRHVDSITVHKGNPAVFSPPTTNKKDIQPFDPGRLLFNKDIAAPTQGDLAAVNAAKTPTDTDEKVLTTNNSKQTDNVALLESSNKPDQPVAAVANREAKPVENTKEQPSVPDMPAMAVTARQGDTESRMKPHFAINIMTSADINGVSSFNNVGTGKNLGVLFSARLNKLTISTGAYYSHKPYSMPFSAYSANSNYKFSYEPQSVIADCRMLDIPLNIDYQVFSKNRNIISIGTGISSYLMLHENYTYSFSGGYRATSYEVKNPDQYLFSAVNFQANYRRQINSKLGINVMPYVKVPLANIGYSQVRLQTVGVAVGFNWNINTVPKPK